VGPGLWVQKSAKAATESVAAFELYISTA